MVGPVAVDDDPDPRLVCCWRCSKRGSKKSLKNSSKKGLPNPKRVTRARASEAELMMTTAGLTLRNGPDHRTLAQVVRGCKGRKGRKRDQDAGARRREDPAVSVGAFLAKNLGMALHPLGQD